MRNEIERLKKKVKKLKRKVKKLKKKLRERVEDEEIHESVMGLCEEQHINEVVEKVEPILPSLSNNFELCFFNLKIVKYMTRLLSTEFIDFVVEVALSISALNWKEESRTNTNTSPINFPINYSVFLILFWFTHYSTLLLLFCFFSLYP
jgi:archaellum component FlaC